MNSINTQIPFDYYYLDICKPEKLTTVSDNIGLLFSHENTFKTNYEITLNENSYCKILCKNKFSPLGIELIKWMIRRDYVVKFYLDKLPAGLNIYPLVDEKGSSFIYYSSGIPLGYLTHDENKIETFYINNHFTFNVKVHHEEKLDKYTIVGFDIIPASINHEVFDNNDNDNDNNSIDRNKNNSNKYEKKNRLLLNFLEDEKNKTDLNSILNTNTNNNTYNNNNTFTNNSVNSSSKLFIYIYLFISFYFYIFIK